MLLIVSVLSFRIGEKDHLVRFQ